MDTDIFLIFEGLQQPAQTIGYRLLRHRAVFKQLTIARIVVTHDDMQLIHLATGALNQIDMPGVQRIELTKYHADALLPTREFQAKKTVQGFQLLRAWAFDFGIQQLAQIAFGHSAGFRDLLQRTALLLNRGFEIVER